MDEIIYSPLFLAILLIILVLLINAFLQIRWRVVPQEERLVIYRLGHFNRIAGPGPVAIIGRLETIERTLRVLDQPANYTVQHLFMHGVPFGYTLNFWRGFDLKSATNNDREAMAKLAIFDDKAREQMIQTKVREAMVYSATAVEQGHQLTPSASIFERMMPILPGLPECEKLLKGVQEKLAQTLPSIGVVLNRTQPITITQLHLGQDLIEGFGFNRMTQLLRQQYPDLPEATMVQVISSIKGANPLSIASVSMADSKSQQVRPEVRIGAEGMSTRMRITPQPEEAQPQPTLVTPPHSDQDDEHLSPNDLSVTKPVPQRPVAQQQRTA